MVLMWQSWTEWAGKLIDVLVSVTVCLFEYEPILFFHFFSAHLPTGFRFFLNDWAECSVTS